MKQKIKKSFYFINRPDTLNKKTFIVTFISKIFFIFHEPT